MLRWMVLALMPLFLFTGCGDLAPEMQDTRTVMLKMDLRQDSSLSRSLVSAADLSAYNTHLIMVLPSWERLSSDYRNYYNIFAEELMDPVSKQVSLEIPLNTQLNIFAFLFKENYSKYDLFTAIKEVGYYGESPSFSITGETNNLSLAVSLTQVPGTDTETDTETDTDTGTDTGTDTTAPVLTEVTAISSPTSDSTPDYTFKSTEAGIISYGGLCSSVRTAAISGDNIIIFDYLIDGNYPDCTITVTDSAGNISIPLPVTNFTVDTSSSNTDTTAPALTEVTAISSPTSDSTPDYTFKSTEAGTISYGGLCKSDSHTAAVSGDNIIRFIYLTDGYYEFCTITVKDYDGNISNTLAVTPFTVDTISNMSAPDNFSASGTSDTVTLSWNSVSGALSYTVYWDTVSGIDSSDTTIQDISTNNYTHSGLDNSTTYYYKVAAIDSSGTGTLSAEKKFNTTLWNGLIAYFPLDGNPDDFTANDYDLTVSGATLSTGRDNSSNTAYYFDGTNNYLSKALSPTLTLNNFTVSLWVKSSTDQSIYTGIFASYNSASSGFQISYATDQSSYRYRSTTSDEFDFGFSDNSWKFLTVTYDGSNTVLYHNGVSVSTFTGGDNVFTNFTLGRNRAGDQYLNGSIDELRIYERALNTQEITDLYNL